MLEGDASSPSAPILARQEQDGSFISDIALSDADPGPSLLPSIMIPVCILLIMTQPVDV